MSRKTKQLISGLTTAMGILVTASILKWLIEKSIKTRHPLSTVFFTLGLVLQAICALKISRGRAIDEASLVVFSGIAGPLLTDTSARLSGGFSSNEAYASDVLPWLSFLMTFYAGNRFIEACCAREGQPFDQENPLAAADDIEYQRANLPAAEGAVQRYSMFSKPDNSIKKLLKEAAECGIDLDTIAVPDGLFCPISHEIMEDPVSTVIGNVYNRADICKWLENKDTDPLFGVTLIDKSLSQHNETRADIITWLQTQINANPHEGQALLPKNRSVRSLSYS